FQKIDCALMILSFLSKYRDCGLLFLRIALGIMFVCHGVFMVSGWHGFGWHSLTARWHEIGAAGMKPLGVNSFLTFWGALAFFSEFAGGILLIVGLWFRPACLLLAITLTVATIMHVK